MNKGIVYLVGAGPGDLGLVTLRAKELISTADVIVYDYLAHPDLLNWAKPECEKLFVGKRSGRHSIAQSEIEAILVKHAKAGRRVVRLKGGDPFVFGRGGEEMRTLAKDKIQFEVVPGVTAALAAGAYAGIPLTQRNSSSSLIILTGHEDILKTGGTVDWRSYGAVKNATLAVYMGMGHIEHILSELVAGGMSPKTPAAVVQWASLGKQRSVVATVGTLAKRVAEQGVESPAIILVGEVVAHQERTDWFSHLPLHGRRVAVTRTREQAGELRSRLEKLGAEVLEVPMIKVTPEFDKDTMLEVFGEIGGYDWLVFTSANGVRHFFDLFFRAFKDIRSLGVMRIACVGESTAKAVRDLHLEVEIAPENAVAEELAKAMIATGSLDSAKVLVITGNRNRDVLVKMLDEARAIVDQFQVYRTDNTDLSEDPAAAEFRRAGADAILFASSSAVQSFASQAKFLQLEPGARRPLAGSIGPITSEGMKKAGIPVDFQAKVSNLDTLIEALIAKLNGA